MIRQIRIDETPSTEQALLLATMDGGVRMTVVEPISRKAYPSYFLGEERVQLNTVKKVQQKFWIKPISCTEWVITDRGRKALQRFRMAVQFDILRVRRGLKARA